MSRTAKKELEERERSINGKKRFSADGPGMLARFRTLFRFVAVIVVTLNVEKITQDQGVDSWFGMILREGPAWLNDMHWLLTQRWILFLAGLYLGAVITNGLTGLHGRYTGRHGQVPLWWIRRRMALVRRLIGNPSLTALVDLRRELDNLNDELTAPGLALPSLPTTNPHDGANMAIVRYYVTTVAPLLRKRTLSEARSIADAIVLHRLT